VLGQLIAPQVRVAYFVKIVFTTETLFLWSGLGSITPPGPPWDPANNFPYGVPFTGLGWLGRIESIPQDSNLTAQNIRLSLSGIVPRMVGDAINAVRLTGSLSVWVAFLDQNNQVIADPLPMWQGQTDVPTIDEGAETSNLSLTAENALLALNLASNRRFTTVDQQRDYPGDSGFDYVTAMQDLYLPFPVGLLSPERINSSNLDDAPDTTSSVSVTPGGPQKLALGGSLNLIGSAIFATGPYANHTENVTSVGSWSSSDTNVAIVTNGIGGNILSGRGNWGTGGGLVLATGPGNCTITFFFGQQSVSLTVSVA
jgi:hypothetical protein